MSLCQVAFVILFSYLDSGLADYSLEVKVHSYTNPSHRDASGQCCYFLPFPLLDCIYQCSNTFVFCPFIITSQPAGPDNCPLGIQSFEGNDNIVGLDYTLIFNGTSWPGYLNMSIQISYLNALSHPANVDQFIIQNVPITIGTNFTAVTAYKGIHQNGNISLSFRVTCKRNFSGSSCNTLCPGVGCDGGCTTSPCVNGGTCMPMTATYRCVCPTGYTGQDCGTIMNTLNPCQNGAAHTSLSLGGYNCSCASSGINCSNNVGRISTALIHTTGIPIAVPSTAISIAAVIHSTMTTTRLVTIATTTTGLVTIAVSRPAAMISSAPPMVSTGATNGLDATMYMSAPGSAGHLCTRPTPSSGDDVMEAIDSSPALAPVIAGVVVPLVVMVTLVAVGSIIIAGYIVHKRSKNHRVGVVKTTSPPLQADVHNPIYSSAGVVDAMENTVHVCDYEIPVMKYEVIKDCKEKEKNSTYATVGPEPVYYGV